MKQKFRNIAEVFIDKLIKQRFVCISWTMPYIEGCVRIHDWKYLEEIAEVGLQASEACQF